MIALAVLGGFVWSGISAGLDARDAYVELQAELSHLTPVDLIQVGVYQSLEGRFKRAEEATDRARSRLGFLRGFYWLPGVGKQLKEVHILLDVGFYQARAGRNLAGVHSTAISASYQDPTPTGAANLIGQVLRESAPQLNLVHHDIMQVVRLHGELKELGPTQRGARYVSLLDRYLPSIQTVDFLSRTSPESIGLTYSLNTELVILQEMVEDFLDVIASPEEVGNVLANVTEQATALELALDKAHQAALRGEFGTPENLESVAKVLDTLGPGVTLLKRVTVGAQSLVTIAAAMESTGLLSQQFGEVVGASLTSAQSELALAREQVDSFRNLLSAQGIDAESFLPDLGFGETSDLSLSTTSRVELLLDDALSAVTFLTSFLGYDAPRTYLLVGQNQNEIRATGGLIGIAVRARIDKGELTELHYLNSQQVDQPQLADNPVPPEPIFWYLWMGKLFFRDANWSPHFPTTAAILAELYQTGQAIKVDGVIAAPKLLAIDLVHLFGDITVPELDEVLTREIAEAYIEEGLEYPCPGPGRRPERCFDEDLFFSLQARVTSGVTSDLRPKLFELVKDHLERKNVMIHVFPPQEDRILWERGWNGAVSVVDHDVLMIVDSSLPGHSNTKVDRSWEYRISLNPGRPIPAQLRVRYVNREQAKSEVCLQFIWELSKCYWNYFRVYVSQKAGKIEMPTVPLHEGSLKLIWGYPDADSGSVMPNADIGPARLTELGGYVAVEPGSVMVIPIQYELPSEILRSTAPGVHEYRLLIQKQSGMDRDRVTIEVELPAEARLLQTSPEFNSRKGRWIIFNFQLVADTTVVVSFSMP